MDDAGRLTRRQRIAWRDYRPGHVTQRQLGVEWGIGRSGVAMRIHRARRRLGLDAARPRAPRRVRVRVCQLSACQD